MTNTVILIPSRLAATRLPNKPLLKINNISIINHVYKIAKSSLIGESYVATGDKEIFEEVTKFGGKCILTKKDHKTGTDRIFEAYQELRDDNIEYVINLQGDEPMLDIEDVTNLLEKTIKKQSKISTLACQIEDEKFFLNTNVVKVITKEELLQNNLSTATSFTREIKNTQKNIYHHIGIYIYNVTYLERFVQLEQTQNEKSQKLEQLRLMDNNIEIDVGLAKTKPIGVDTDEDYLEIKKIMEYKN
ncbi:3-deoxy-manno-octulosonate cytidylyltransferase [Pelagibacterales bacterium SAG-MED17]|nr:3-deoxy-manno-octulosonate cytidylyltransferase [Pelagibacterales bacterium SAG-MED17]